MQLVATRCRTGTRKVVVALGTVTLLAASTVLIGAPRAGAAPALPVATLSVPTGAGAPLLGEPLAVTVTFDNADSDAPGFGPRIDLFIDGSGADGDDGMTFTSATLLGHTLNPRVLTVPSCPFVNPLTGQTVTCPAGIAPGDQFVVINLPFASYAPDQPPTDVTVNLAVSPLADAGVPLIVAARGAFRYGADAIDDPDTDPPIVGAVTSGSYTPSTMRVDKTYLGPEGETATGPNFVRRFQVALDVADGQTVTGANINDVLPDTLVYAGNLTTSPGGATVVSEPTPGVEPPPSSLAARTLGVTFPSITGTTANADAIVEFDVYVAETDSAGQPVLDPVSGDARTTANTATVDAGWTPVDPRDAPGPLPTATDTAQLTARAIATQKSSALVVDTGVSGVSPGDTIEWTVSTQVSDYFTAGDLVLTDVMDDGLTWDSGFTPTLTSTERNTTTGPAPIAPGNVSIDDSSACPNGTTVVQIDVGAALGGLGGLTGGRVGPDSGPATAVVHYRTVVADAFRCPASGGGITEGDTFSNDVTTDASLLTPFGLPTGGDEGDDSSASVEVATGGFQKVIYARNGSTTGPFDLFAEGDTITYRLTRTLEIGNVRSLALDDFLPLPSLPVTGFSTTFDASTPSAAVPATGTARYGPTHDFLAPAFPGAPVPTVIVDPVSNRLRFDFGDYDITDGATTATVDVLFTLTISDDPFADGLYLTNVAQSIESNSAGEVITGEALVPFVLTNPVLELSKGVVASDAPAPLFTPATVGPVTFGPPGSDPTFNALVTTPDLDATPIDSDLSGVDAGDLVTFAVVVQNTGSGLNGAFDVLVSDLLPSGFSPPTGGLNLQVRRGDGVPIVYVDVGAGLFDPVGGIRLVDGPNGSLDPLDENTADTGTNLAVVTYDLVLDGTVEPSDLLTNTSSIDAYASVEGGQNFVTTPITDDATVTVQAVTVAKDVVTTSASHTTGLDVVIGELVTYAAVVTLPEGTTPGLTVTDTLDCGLALESIDGIVGSGGVTTSAPGGFAGVASTAVIGNPTCPGGEGAGRSVTFDLGTVTNANRDDAAPDTITFTYTAAVLNASVNTEGQLRNNSVTTSAGGSASAPDLTVRTPRPTLTKAFDAATADAGDTVSVTLVASNPTAIDVYQASLVDTLPAALTVVLGSFNCSGTLPNTIDPIGPVVGATWSTLAAGESTTCTFDVVIDAATVDPGSVTNTANLDWTSLPGNVDSSPSPWTTLDVERTGDAGDPGQLNDFVATASDTVTLGAPEVVKSLIATSAPQTSGTDVTIGEIATYRIDVTLAEGTYASGFVVADQLPPGLEYIPGSVTVDTTGFQGSIVPAPSITAAGGSGDDVTATFAGPVTVDPDNDPTNNTFTITLDAVVADVSAATAGATLTNTASVTAAGLTSTSDPVSLTVIEPRLTIDKDVAGQVADDDTLVVGVDGDLDYTVTITNGSTFASPAYDVIATDVVPAGLVVDVASVAIGGGAYDVGTRTITWSIPGPFASGASQSFTYSAEVGDSIGLGAATRFVNAATIDRCFGFPASVRTDPANAAIDYRPYGGQTDTVTVTPDFPLLVVDKSSTGPAVIGEPFPWTIAIRNDATVATAFGVDAVDQLPTGWTYAPGTSTLDGAPIGDPVVAGQQLTWTNLANLTPGAVVQLGYTALPGWDARANATNVNSVTVTGDDADGSGANADGPYTATDTDDPGLTGASIGDLVWEDLDGNGRQDAGEPGIDGVAVNLTWAGPDTTFGTPDDEPLTTTTAGGGQFSFTVLPAGPFRVDVVDPAGYVPTVVDSSVADDLTDSDGSAAPIDVTTTAGIADTSVDAGFVRLVDLGDRAWVDDNGNGIQDPGEVGLFGVDVALTWWGVDAIEGTGDDAVIGSTTTASDGSYALAGLAPGTYGVVFTAPGGYEFTPAGRGADRAVDSNPDAAGAASIVLVSGIDDPTVDAGAYLPADVGDFVWYDLDDDGVQGAPADVAAGGITVQLLDSVGTVVGTTTTNGAGAYGFAGLAPGVYSVHAVAPPGFAYTVAGQGTATTDSDVDEFSGVTPQFQLTSGESNPDVDAGLVPTSSIGDLVWQDLDGDGLVDGGEPGIANVDVWLVWGGRDGTIGTGDDVTVGRRITDAAGAYRFENLPPGRYRLTVLGVPAGFVPTFDPDGVGTASVAQLTLAADDENDDADFGYQQQADLSLLKTVLDDEVDAGEVATFTVTVANAGPAVAATGIGALVTVVDTLPTGLTLVGASGTGWTCTPAAQIVTCTRPGPMAVGAAVPAITVTATVDADAPTSLTNSATVSTGTVDPTPANNTDIADVTATLVADLVITKSHTVDFVVGTTGSWSIVVSNDGPSDSVGTVAQPITVTDAVPNVLLPVAASGSGWVCGIVGQDVTCTRSATIVDGAAAPPITIQADVDPAGPLIADGGDVVNTAVVSTGATPDRDLADNSDDDPTTVIPVADLGIVKSSGGSFVVGSDATYTFVVSNTGPSTGAADITIDDTLVTGLTYASSSSADAWTCSAIGPDVTCTLGTGLANGASTSLTITVGVDATIDPSVTNTATVQSPTFDPDTSNNSSSVTDPSTPTVDLVIDKAHAGSFQVGQTGTFTLDVGNAGPSVSDGLVTVTDAVPAGLTPLTVDGTAADPSDPSWACSITGQSVECTIVATVPVGGSLPTITLVVNVLAGAYPSPTNTAVVTPPPGLNEDVTANNSDDDVVDVDPLVDLAIDKSHDGTFVVGEPGEYTLEVTNAGPTADPGPVTIVDDLPLGITFVSGAGVDWHCGAVGQTVACVYVGTPIPVGGSTTVRLVVAVSTVAEGGVVNTATVSTVSDDADPTNDTDSDPTLVDPAADLAITKTHLVDPVVGTPFDWTIAVDNLGPSTSPGPITVTDAVPAGLLINAAGGADWACTITAQDLACTRAAPLAPGTAPPISLTVTPQVGFEGTVTNTAAVTGTIFDPVMSNNSADDRVALAPSIDLAATKSLAAGTMVRNTTATWWIDVSNRGPSVATGVTAADRLPAGLHYVSAGGPGWTCTAAGQLVTCVHPLPLGPGDSSGFGVVTMVDAPTGTRIVNTAVVRGDGVDADTSNNFDGATGRVLAASEERSPAAAPPDELSMTGTDSVPLVVTASALVLLGIGLVLLRRRQG